MRLWEFLDTIEVIYLAYHSYAIRYTMCVIVHVRDPRIGMGTQSYDDITNDRYRARARSATFCARADIPLSNVPCDVPDRARADIPMLGVRYTGEFCVTLASNPTLHNGRDQGNIGCLE